MSVRGMYENIYIWWLGVHSQKYRQNVGNEHHAMFRSSCGNLEGLQTQHREIKETE